MGKFIPLALCAYIFCFGLSSAQAEDKAKEVQPETKVEQQKEAQEKITAKQKKEAKKLTKSEKKKAEAEALAKASKKQTEAKDKKLESEDNSKAEDGSSKEQAEQKTQAPIIEPSEIISEEEMELRLKNNPADDILYVRLDKEKVEVYPGTAEDRSMRKKIIYACPVETMIRLYTTNKATASVITRMLGDYESDYADVGGYRIITDIDKPYKLENGNTIYKPWFMKVIRERRSRGGGGIPIGIGIGIGIGRRSHSGIGIWF